VIHDTDPASDLFDIERERMAEELPRSTPSDACRGCGCTDDHACDPPCWWVSDDLCSTCANTEELS